MSEAVHTGSGLWSVLVTLFSRIGRKSASTVKETKVRKQVKRKVPDALSSNVLNDLTPEEIEETPAI